MTSKKGENGNIGLLQIAILLSFYSAQYLVVVV